MARPSPDFIERTLELQGTVRARASAAETAWALRSAAHTGEDAFDALARRVTSSPVRVAGVLSGEHDPLLLCALAGKRSMEDLAGVTPAGGRSNAAPTMLESLAAKRVQQHWELCRTDPVHAKRLEAQWAASRATMRSGHLGPALSAMEATYGAACSAEREAAQGRLVSTVPPASWDPAGAHAGRLAGYGSERWNRMRGQAVAETQMPAEWEHRRTRSPRGQRPRARFVARGAGRLEQLADTRFSPRMAASRIAFQVRLKLVMARGPAATRRFLTSVASNPRRAAAAVRARLDPMVVAAAIGPRAIEGMLAGKPVREAGPLGRLQDELHKRDVARLQDVRTGPDGGVADIKAQRDALDGGLASARGMRDASERFVDKVWQGDDRPGAAGGGWSADSALGEQFQQGSVDGSVYDAWRARREAVVEGAGAEQLQERFGAQRWSAVDSSLHDRAAEEALSQRFAELGGADAGYRLRCEVVLAGDPEAGIDQVEALHLERQDLRAARGEAVPDSRAESDWAVGDTERRPGDSTPLSTVVPSRLRDEDCIAAQPSRDPAAQQILREYFEQRGGEAAGYRLVDADLTGGLRLYAAPNPPGPSFDVERHICDETLREAVFTAATDTREGVRCLPLDRADVVLDPKPPHRLGVVYPSDPEGREIVQARLEELGGADKGFSLRTDEDGYVFLEQDHDTWCARCRHSPDVVQTDRAWADKFHDEADARHSALSSEEREARERAWRDERVGSSGPSLSPPGAGSAPVPGTSIVIPAEALRDVEIPEEDLPKMTQEAEPPPNGSWKVHDDDRIDRVVPREDGSYEVRFKPGVVPAQGLGEDAASQTHKRRTDPQLVELQNERTAQTVDLERAARETLADAVEHGRAPFDVERAGYMPGAATNAFSREPVGGVDGDLLRAKAIRQGEGHDLRFATREQIEAAGGKVSPEAEGVIVMREVPVSAQPFGENGEVDRNADPVQYRVKSPEVLYHVSTETDLARGQVPSQPLGAPVPDLTAEDLCKSVGVSTREMSHPQGRSEFQRANPKDNVPEDTIVIAKDGGESVAERNGRLVGAAVRATLSSNRGPEDPRPAAPQDAYSRDVPKAKVERRLVEVMAADRAAGRIGVAYRTSPPVTAKERKEFTRMLKDPQVRERLGREVDRVSSWVADGAQQRLNDRGVQTVHQRAQGVPPPAQSQDRPAPRQQQQQEQGAYAR